MKDVLNQELSVGNAVVWAVGPGSPKLVSGEVVEIKQLHNGRERAKCRPERESAERWGVQTIWRHARQVCKIDA